MTESLAKLLHSPRRTADALQRAEAKYQAQYSECLRITPGYRTDGGGGGGTAGAKDGAWAALADRRAEIGALEKEHEEAVNEVRRFLRTLEVEFPEYGTRDALLLRCRYLRGRDWSMTRKMMADYGYLAKTERTLFNWHRCALDRCEALLRKETNQ